MNRTANKRKPAARAAARRVPTRSKPAAAPVPTVRELWLASLGAAATTGEAASKLVDLLVVKGRAIEPRVRASAERALSTLSSETRRFAAKAADELVTRTRGAVEAAVERLGVTPRKRAKNVLHRLGDLAEAIL